MLCRPLMLLTLPFDEGKRAPPLQRSGVRCLTCGCRGVDVAAGGRDKRHGWEWPVVF